MAVGAGAPMAVRLSRTIFSWAARVAWVGGTLPEGQRVPNAFTWIPGLVALSMISLTAVTQSFRWILFSPVQSIIFRDLTPPPPPQGGLDILAPHLTPPHVTLLHLTSHTSPHPFRCDFVVISIQLICLCIIYLSIIQCIWG